MSNISIIKVYTISLEELDMYLAEFIRSFRLRDREYYEPSGLICLVSSSERYFDFFFACFQYVALFLSRSEIYVAIIFHDRFINHCLFDN